MQCVFKKNFKERILFYWSKLFSGQLKPGEAYEKLHATYSLVFTEDTLFKDLKSYYSSFSLRRDEEPYIVFSPYLKIVVVELSKFRESFDNLDKKGLWSYFIKHSSSMTDKDLRNLSSRSRVMGVAIKELKKMSEEESMQFLAEAREKARRDREAEIQHGIDTGFERGIKQGFDKGVESGIKQGFDRGISQKTQEVALKMIRKGSDPVFVSEVTGLSLKQLSKLKKEKS